MSDSVRPHRQRPTRLPCPWDSPGKNTGVGCHFLLQCMKVKNESEVTQSCPTLSNPMDFTLPAPPSTEFSRQEYGSSSIQHWASQVALVVENMPAKCGRIRDMCSIPASGRSPGGGHGNPLQYPTMVIISSFYNQVKLF